MHIAARIRAVAPLAVIALLAGVAGVAGSYAAAGFTPTFVAAPVERVIARTTPGVIVTLAITILGNLGQKLSLAGAIALTVTLFGSLSLAGLVTGRNAAARLAQPLVTMAGPLLAALAVWIASVLLTGAAIPAVGAGVGVGVILAIAEVTRLTNPATHDATRRSVLASVAGAVGVGVLGYSLGRGTDTQQPSEAVSISAASAQLLNEAETKSLEIDGLEPLVSDNFYQVDINSVDPTVNLSDWSLTVTGAVDTERAEAHPFRGGSERHAN